MLSSLKEWLRYEQHWAKLLLFPALVIANIYYRHRGHLPHLRFLSSVYRLTWPGTFNLVSSEVKRRYLTDNGALSRTIFDEILNDVNYLENFKKFTDDPSSMLDGIITVVAPYTKKSRGIITIAYSYYFPLFLKFYDVEAVEEKYHIVLEPSWNGLCDESILIFTCCKTPVFVMAYEDRDFAFIEQLKTNLVPLKLSANWSISPDQFTDGLPHAKRDIDVIMVAAWAKFKRHDKFFTAIKTLRERGRRLNVTLVGYPNDLKLEDIKQLSKDVGIADQITFYEWITPEKVSDLLGRAKVNIIWSRFEGLNRAIIEGMFCNTPCILREGFNFGMHYPYINEKTGCFATEKQLPDKLLTIIDSPQGFAPRDYVVKYHNCFKAAEILGKEVARYDNNFDPQAVVAKKSGLNGIEYISEAQRQQFAPDYAILTQLCLSNGQKLKNKNELV